jgi:hypothetical protein
MFELHVVVAVIVMFNILELIMEIVPNCPTELASVGKPVDDDELIGHILYGLDGSYNSLVTTVNGNPNTSLDVLFGQLSSYDMRNNALEESSDGTFSSSINAARQDNDRDYRDRGCHQEYRGCQEYRGDYRGGGDYRRDDDRRDRRDDDSRDWRRDDDRRDRRDRSLDGGDRRCYLAVDRPTLPWQSFSDQRFFFPFCGVELVHRKHNIHIPKIASKMSREKYTHRHIHIDGTTNKISVMCIGELSLHPL